MSKRSALGSGDDSEEDLSTQKDRPRRNSLRSKKKANGIEASMKKPGRTTSERSLQKSEPKTKSKGHKKTTKKPQGRMYDFGDFDEQPAPDESVSVMANAAEPRHEQPAPNESVSAVADETESRYEQPAPDESVSVMANAAEPRHEQPAPNESVSAVADETKSRYEQPVLCVELVKDGPKSIDEEAVKLYIHKTQSTGREDNNNPAPNYECMSMKPKNTWNTPHTESERVNGHDDPMRNVVTLKRPLPSVKDRELIKSPLYCSNVWSHSCDNGHLLSNIQSSACEQFDAEFPSLNLTQLLSFWDDVSKEARSIVSELLQTMNLPEDPTFRYAFAERATSVYQNLDDTADRIKEAVYFIERTIPLLVLPSDQMQDKKDRLINILKADKESLSRKIDRMKKDMTELSTKNRQLSLEKNSLVRDNGRLKREYDKLVSEKAILTQDKKDLARERDSLRKENERLKRDLSKQVNGLSSFSISGRQKNTELLAKIQSLEDQLNLQMQRADANESQILHLEEQRSTEKGVLNSKIAELERQVSTLEIERQQNRTKVSDLESRVASLQQEMDNEKTVKESYAIRMNRLSNMVRAQMTAIGEQSEWRINKLKAIHRREIEALSKRIVELEEK